MCNVQPDEVDIKLTPDNWEEVTHKTYHLEFLNTRNAVRTALYDLLQIDNAIKCNNVEIQSLKTTFDSDLAFMEAEIQRFQENEYLEEEDKNKEIAEMIKKIEAANANFSNEIERFQLVKEQTCSTISQNVDKLFEAKAKFRGTHRRQVESIRRFRMFCSREIRPKVEVRLKSVDRKFCDEFFYIESCEQNLKPLFSLIEDKSSRSGICGASSTTTAVSDVCVDFFSDFAWMRNEQFARRSELFDYFKKYVAKDLLRALAAMHVHKPDEPIKFIANFLKHLKQNAFRIKKQDEIYAASRCGLLYPACIQQCGRPF